MRIRTLPRKSQRELVSEHLYEMLVTMGLLMLLLGPLEAVGRRHPSVVPWQFLLWAGVLAATTAWFVLIRPRQLSFEVARDDLVIRNFWRCHVVHVSQVVEVRQVRGRTAFPLIEVSTVDGADLVIESVDFRSIDLVAHAVSPGDGVLPSVHRASDAPMFEELGYHHAEPLDQQARALLASMLDGSWVRRLVRIY